MAALVTEDVQTDRVLNKTINELLVKLTKDGSYVNNRN